MDQNLHFPIKVINGDITTQHTKIKEGTQDLSPFKAPAGYTKMGTAQGVLFYRSQN
jgi:hypothetical protein